MESPDVDGVTFTLNGREVVARRGELIIDAAERNGVYIPRFCYHSRMRPVGMCRMCIVEVDTGRGPALQPTCMLECTDGMVVDTESDITRKAQDGVLEFLLLNHPLDCPVCDKGGECPLQDQTVSHGPGESRLVEEKRHNEKPIAISDLVLLDRERCILCDRCTRFAKEVAGDPLIHFMNRGNGTEVNTFPDHPFASYFSGNTVQICPVGALTAVPYRFKARPWDLQQVESTCTTCSVGCRIVIQTSRNRILRHNGVDSDPVNWGWLCDKGRFGFEAVHSERRLIEPLMRVDGELKASRWSDALDAVAGGLAEAIKKSGPGSVAVLGGSRLTNEDAYAWVKLAKGIVGTDNVDCRLSDALPAEFVLGVRRATIDETCRPGGTVVVVGSDVKEELPVLYLRLRHAAVNDGVRIIEVSTTPTGLSPYAAVRLAPRPGEASAVVAAIVAGRTEVEVGGVLPDDLSLAAGLLESEQVTVVAGRGSPAESFATTVDSVSALLHGMPNSRVLSALRRGNVHGALDAGMAPGILPGRVSLAEGRDWFESHWPSVPTDTGLDTAGVLDAAAAGEIAVLFLVGVDINDIPDRTRVRAAMGNVPLIVAVDQFLSDTSDVSHVVLPAAGTGECAGTTTNLEGRVTRLGAAVTPPGTAQPPWVVANELSRRIGVGLGVDGPASLWNELARVGAAQFGVSGAALGSHMANDGIVLPEPDVASYLAGIETPVQISNREESASTAPLGVPPLMIEFQPPEATPPSPLDAYSLRLATTRRLYDSGVLVRESPSLAKLPSATRLRINPYDFDRLGIAVEEEVRVSTNRGSLTIGCVPEPAIPRGTAWLDLGQPNLDVAELLDAGSRVTDVRVETL